MGKNVAQVLLSLSEIDREVYGLLSQQKAIETERDTLAGRIKTLRDEIKKLSSRKEETKIRQAADEAKLHDEEKRIVDRRKALTELGGAKSARLVEREIDIAQRSVQALEEQAVKSIAELEGVGQSIEVLEQELATMEKSFEDFVGSNEKQLKEIEKQVGAQNKKRNQVANAVDDRVRSLYLRVSKRYPDSPVAQCSKGSCRSCFRALPSQTYNQVLAGSLLIQCPGCSRILVHVE